jgi:hypothetical protein
MPDFDGRTFKAPPAGETAFDWMDDLGRKYDQMGDGTKSQFHKFDEFKEAIDGHLLKQGNDFTVIDMTGYTPAQIAQVKNYVDSLPKALQDKIVRVGF